MAGKLALITLLAVVAVAASAYIPVGHFISKRAVLLDEDFEPLVRTRRDYPAPAPVYHHPPGKVGPVFTFVKTDYHGNVKWGVRHNVGKQYAVPTNYDRESEDAGETMMMSGSGPVIRTKRGHHHHIPTWMNTYVMTDHHGHFKWGVRHNIKHH